MDPRSRQYVPRFAQDRPTWIALKNTAMPEGEEIVSIRLEEWVQDGKDSKMQRAAEPLVVYELRYTQGKAKTFMDKAQAGELLMMGPDVYQVRRGKDIVANVWQPVMLQTQVEITMGTTHLLIPAKELTVELLIKQVNQYLGERWQRPTDSRVRFDLVLI